MTGAAGSAGTKGFLFSDLRGYSAFVEARGDQAAAELLATYRELVREVIAAHNGAEIRTEGDSVYVVFPAASAAVEAGLAITAAAAERSTRERSIRVGVGIHAGETVATTEGLVGGAVNIAARVCAKAQPGEVLVTDTVRALTRTFLPYRYTGLGTQQLKGIAGGIPLYRVELTPTTTRARLRRQLSARRGRVLIVTGLAVVLIAVAAGFAIANRGPDCLILPATTRDVVAKIDPDRNCVVATYRVGRRPGPIAVGVGGIWVTNVDDWTVSWIDITAGPTVTTGMAGAPVAIDVDPLGNAYLLLRDDRTVGVGEVHFGRDRAAKVDLRTKQVAETRMLPEIVTETSTGAAGYSSIAYSGGRVWVSDSYQGNVVAMRFGSGWVNVPVGQGSAGAGEGLGPIGAGGGAVWVGNSVSPVLYALEGASARSIEYRLDAHLGVTSMAVTDSAVWLGRGDGSLTRCDTGNGSIRSFKLEGLVTSVAAGSGAVWTADHPGRVTRCVDSESGKVLATIEVGGRPGGIAIAGDGSVWVAIQGP